MVDNRIARLVRRLHENTQSKKISWETTSDSSAFVATFPRYSVRIESNGPDYIINIVNDQGLVVDRFTDVDLTRQFGDIEPGQGWFFLLDEIFEMARRQALGADEAIDAILEELK